MSARAGALVRLLGSDRAGEVAAAAAALGRLLKAEGKDWHWLGDLAERHLLPVKIERPEWQIRAENLMRLAEGRLTHSERDFLLKIAGWRYHPSESQMRWLDAIEAAMTGRCAA